MKWYSRFLSIFAHPPKKAIDVAALFVVDHLEGAHFAVEEKALISHDCVSIYDVW